MLWGGRWEGDSCLGTHVRIKDFKIKKKSIKKKKRLWNLDSSTIWAMAELCDKGFSLQGQLLVVFFFFNSMFYHCKSKIRMLWKTWEVVKSFKLIFQNFFIKIPQLLSFCCISAHNFCIKYSLYLSSLVWGLNTILSAFYYITKKIFWLTSW